MGQIDVNIKKLRNESNDLSKLTGKLQKAEEVVRTVKSNVSLGASTSTVKAQLGKIEEQLKAQANSIKCIGAVLDEIATMYVNAEQKIKDDLWEAVEKCKNALEALFGLLTDDNVSDDLKEALTDLLEDENTPKNLMEILGHLKDDDTAAAWDDLKEILRMLAKNNLSDESILDVMDALTGEPLTMDAGEIAQHRQQNDTQWQNEAGDRTGMYIDNQRDYGDYAYGTSNVAGSGCGIIATYNALQHLTGGNAPAFPELIENYENEGMTAYGELGTNMNSIKDYLEGQGYTTQQLTGNDINSSSLANMDGQYNTFIMMTYNDADDIFNNIHYVTIVEDNGQYVIRNGGQENIHYASLEEAVEGYNGGAGEPITITGVG